MTFMKPSVSTPITSPSHGPLWDRLHDMELPGGLRLALSVYVGSRRPAVYALGPATKPTEVMVTSNVPDEPLAADEFHVPPGTDRTAQVQGVLDTLEEAKIAMSTGRVVAEGYEVWRLLPISD